MDDATIEDAQDPQPERTGASGLLRRAELIGQVARLMGRTATVLALVALAVGLVVWGLAAGLEVATGPAGWVVLLLCVVPAGAFTLLSWSTRRVARHAGHYPDDLVALYGELRQLPAKLDVALRDLDQAEGLRARVRALRRFAAVLEGSEATAAGRERFQVLHETATVWVPATSVVGLLGMAVLSVALPTVLAIAVVT